MHCERTRELIAGLDNMALRIDTIKSFLNSGHDLEPQELAEWIEAVGRYNIGCLAMMTILRSNTMEPTPARH